MTWPNALVWIHWLLIVLGCMILAATGLVIAGFVSEGRRRNRAIEGFVATGRLDVPEEQVEAEGQRLADEAERWLLGDRERDE